MHPMDAKPFAHELALLPELLLREKKVAERLKDLPVEAAVELLHALVRLAETGDDDARIALLACVGLSASVAQFAMTRAYASGGTLLTANLGFTGIVFSSVFGIAIFGDVIHLDSAIGMAIIVG